MIRKYTNLSRAKLARPETRSYRKMLQNNLVCHGMARASAKQDCLVRKNILGRTA